MNTKALLIATAVIAATTTAALSGQNTDLLRQDRSSVAIEDIAVDAFRSFHEIDINDDGMIDVDEYAAQAIVYAELARFNRYVTIETEETTIIPLPRNTPDSVTLAERTRIETISRREYYVYAGDDGEMSPRDWIASRQAEADHYDTNEDGIVEAGELQRLAMSVAQWRQPGA